MDGARGRREDLCDWRYTCQIVTAGCEANGVDRSAINDGDVRAATGGGAPASRGLDVETLAAGVGETIWARDDLPAEGKFAAPCLLEGSKEPRRLGAVEERLAKDPEAMALAESRRASLALRASDFAHVGTRLAERTSLIDVALERLRGEHYRRSERASEAGSRLGDLRRERVEAERSLTVVREQVGRLEVEDAETRMRLETLVERIRADFDCEPSATLDVEAPIAPEGSTLAGRGRDLDRELRIMGPINPLALEEYDALQERHDFLQQQLEDVKSSRRELQRVIKAVDQEIISVFEKAFDDVQGNFTDLFTTLFPGGSGRIFLTDPSNLLETGIEIEARPSGKNTKRLSLLSGGERSLTALAFLFAVFRSRPSPFYLLDEVEAALDDVNLHRFLDLVREFRDEAQLLIVTHQRRTMEAGDCMFGVSMPPGGSTKVVSQRMRGEIVLQ